MNWPVAKAALVGALTVTAVGCAGNRAPGLHSGHDMAVAATSDVPLFEDLGTHHHAITTTSPQAQRYFDQGLRLIYGFNHDEAIRAFQMAAKLDPQCAMAWWGIGFAHGPNYNLPLDAERARSAYTATQQAVRLAPKASQSEQQYIEALSRRYSADPQVDRHALDEAFAEAMGHLAARFPDDADAATLYAESMMDLRPWDLWTADGSPQPGTTEIVATLERVLAEHPNHPGANHYYIHAIEGSANPEKGLPSAERLKTLVPGAGHLVHMPSHIYMRLGNYKEATETNRHAAEVDETYIKAVAPQGVYPMMYYPHNLHFLWAAASMEGRRADALDAAQRVVAQLPPEAQRAMPMLEFYAPTYWFALVRFGRWQQMIDEPAPPADLQYTTALWHYARGIALASTHHLPEAQDELDELRGVAAQIPLERIVGDNQSAAQMTRLATATLAGELAGRRGDADSAQAELTAAVDEQDRLPYMEPPPWHYPARQSLGAVLLAAGRAAQAESVYRDDLERNPENGWSLFGLHQSLIAQGRMMEANCVYERFLKAWQRSDVKLTASRF